MLLTVTSDNFTIYQINHLFADNFPVLYWYLLLTSVEAAIGNGTITAEVWNWSAERQIGGQPEKGLASRAEGHRIDSTIEDGWKFCGNKLWALE